MRKTNTKVEGKW